MGFSFNGKTAKNITYNNQDLQELSYNSTVVWTKSRLPAEYQKVEYIESSGTQHILTDIVPHNEMGVYMKLSSSDVNSDLIYFGSRKWRETRFWTGNEKWTLYFGWNTVTSNKLRPGLTQNQIFTFELNFLNSRMKKFNNTLVENITAPLSSNNNVPLAIFAGNDNGAINYNSKIKLYEFKISEGTNITYDFVPCYRKSDNEAGLFDIVNNRFYTNQGTGSFTYGELQEL